MASVTHAPANRRTIREQVGAHPLLAFVALSYALSSFWLLSYRIDLGTVNGFGVIASMAPALAAMIVSACVRPVPSGIPAGKRWRLFGTTAVLALGVMAALRLWVAAGLVTVTGMDGSAPPYPTVLALFMDVLAAGIVGFVLSGVHSPRQGVRDLLRTLDPRRHSVRWYWLAIAIGLYPIVFALGNVISQAAGLPVPAPGASGTWYWLALTALIVFAYYLFGGGGLEEPGWRGLALPRLQRRYSPLRSSLILGVIWTFWHWPHMWLALPEAGPLVVVSFLLQVVPLAILFTAVFNGSGASLLVAVLLHATINLTDLFLPASTLGTGLLMLLILIVGLWMWRSPTTFSSREQGHNAPERSSTWLS